MKPVYDFLKTTSKKGGISLSAEWLETNLGIQKGDTIISVSVGGKVLLTRFNPDVAVDAKTLEMLAGGQSNSSVTLQSNEQNDVQADVQADVNSPEQGEQE
ncbi:MAG: AbrB/MazE/SpoVT family DNA-binding domain-containing protein [Pseudomonadota bacterium]